MVHTERWRKAEAEGPPCKRPQGPTQLEKPEGYRCTSWGDASDPLATVWVDLGQGDGQAEGEEVLQPPGVAGLEGPEAEPTKWPVV